MRLDDCLMALRGRVAPVVRREPAADRGEEANAPCPSTELGEILAGLAFRLGNVARELEQLTEAIEL
jgi:hypothetical protein